MIRFGTYTTKSWLSHKPNGEYRIAFPCPNKQPILIPESLKHRDIKIKLGICQKAINLADNLLN
jgi:hypothetical protein